MPRLSGFVPPRTPFTAAHVPVGHEYLRAAVDRGAVVRLLRGVYVAADAVPDDPRCRHLQLALAHQMRTPDLVASHRTAALALGLPVVGSSGLPAQPRFSRPPRPTLRSGNHPRVSLRPLHHRDVVVAPDAGWTDLRITAAPRTALDLAGEAVLPEALVGLDWVCRQAAVSRSGRARLRGSLPRGLLQASLLPLQEAMDRIGPRREARLLAEAVALADPRRESPAESLSFGHIHLSDLPDPLCQQPVEGEDGVRYPDFVWPELGVAGEVDGMVKYRLGDAADEEGAIRQHAGLMAVEGSLVREKLRQQALERAGWIVVRWTYAEVGAHPARVLARIAAALRSRGWQGG